MKNTLKKIGKAGAVAGAFALPVVGIPASLYMAKKLYGKPKAKGSEKPPGKFKEWLRLEAVTEIQQSLMKLRPQMAAAAQQVYDEWQQGEDDDLNGGGICHLIAEAITDVVINSFPGNFEGGTVNAACGEQHVWVMMAVGEEGFEIDVPYHIYETGGGYTWQKIPNVKFVPNDIVISPANADDARGALNDPY